MIMLFNNYNLICFSLYNFIYFISLMILTNWYLKEKNKRNEKNNKSFLKYKYVVNFIKFYLCMLVCFEVSKRGYQTTN